LIIENRRARAHVDVPLLILVFSMALFGILAVCVATYSTDSVSDASLLNHIVESSYALRQTLFFVVGIVVVTVIMSIPFDWIRRFTPLIYYAGSALLVVVLFASQATGVKAWLDVLWGYTIQPSELVKLSLILMLARVLSRSERPMSNMREFTQVMLLVGVPSVIILLQGEMGSLLVIIFMFAVMLYFSNVDMKLLLGLAAAAVLAVLAVYGIAVAIGSDNYRLQRILAFFNPDQYASTDAYQQMNSMTAIGSGGLSGIGMFVDGSWSQLNYVPADWTDFIYATIGEAWGFVGCFSILLVYLLIILRLLYLAWYTQDKYGKLIIIGVMGMLLFHVFENIGMTIGLMPITGIPLPFLSYGGSNMVTNMGGIALVLNVTKNRSLSHTILTPQTSVNMYSTRRRY